MQSCTTHYNKKSETNIVFKKYLCRIVRYHRNDCVSTVLFHVLSSIYWIQLMSDISPAHFVVLVRHLWICFPWISIILKISLHSLHNKFMKIFRAIYMKMRLIHNSPTQKRNGVIWNKLTSACVSLWHNAGQSPIICQ